MTKDFCGLGISTRLHFCHITVDSSQLTKIYAPHQKFSVVLLIENSNF